MSKEELEKEAEEYVKQNYCDLCVMADDCKSGCIDCFTVQAYIASAEPREKRIAELEMTVGTLRTFSNEQATCIERLEAQIEKMKNCKNCANYMISGKCPSFFRTGWCKNWEMTRSKK